MKSNLVKSAYSIVILASAFFTLSTTSCKKDKTCYGTVKVTDSAGVSVVGASVLLSAPSVGGQVTYDAITDGNGEASFEIKLPAIFDIFATSPAYPSMFGRGTLRCDEPGKKSGATVKLTL